jgi:YggT family protein
MGNPLTDAGQFLVSTIFGLYISIVALRFLLQWVRADFYNPISQFIVKATNPPLRYLRRWIPGYGGIDWPSLVLMLGLQLIETMILFWIVAGRIPSFPGLLILSAAQILQLIIYIFFFSIIIEIVLSWINPGAYNPVTVIIYRLNEPLLRPARRLIPPIGGLDFSPMVVLVLLQLATILIIRPLMALGYTI